MTSGSETERRAAGPVRLGVAAVLTLGLGLVTAHTSAAALGAEPLPLGATAERTVAASRSLPLAAEQGLACGPVSACTDRCGAECPSGIRKLSCLLGCKSDCRAKGCPSAQKTFDELTDCIASECWTDCMGGPTADCRSCSETECAPEAKKCMAHKCGS